MKVYYAHHIWKYNTGIERYELDLIRDFFPDATIINPKTDVTQPGNYNGSDGEYIVSTHDTMSYCFLAIENSDAIVFSSVSGVVGKGVADEIKHAQKFQKPVYYIYENALHLGEFDFEIITDSNNRMIYAIVKQVY